MSDPLTLTALGGLEMCDGSGQTLAVSPKRGALLVYLALARPRGPQQCDTLLALLYPEHDSTHARMALRQLVREVRQTLGVDVVRSHSRETVALDREVLQSDVWAFEAAISDGDFARAVERYTGPLLAGVHVSGCPEFEEWVEAERARLHRAYTGALEQVALAAMHDGDPGTAATWWRQLLAHEPYASRVTLGLMQALAETGDRAGALQAAAEHAARLRQDFGAEPSREVEMLAARFKDTSPRVRSRQAVALRLAAALGDRYQIEELLGVGGMALVYRASDLRHGRTVALKVLRPELAAATGPKRFLREIAIAAPLNHPNILPLYDSGEADELLYYVMPYIEGESLRDVLAREGRLNVDDAVRLAGEVADALGYAHEAGIVHRDIKPENILISHGHALIADFGVARALSTTDGESSSSGIALGTPEYTSPEQAAGEQAVDARSDVYSLGCVLYEMLGGSPPYTGTTPQQVVSAHRERPVPSVRRINPAVPQGLDAVIARAIAKEPAERYTTAAELKEALVATRVTRSDTTHVPRTRLWRVVRRVALPSLLVTATVIVGVNRYRTATSWKRQPVDANAVAVMPFRVTTTTPEVALLDQGLPDLLYSVLTGDGTVRVVNVQRLLWTWDAMRERGDTASVDARLRLAADLGAGKLMTGAVVEADTELIVNAWLHRVPDDEELAQHSFRIPKDDVNALLTGVVYGLIGAELGEDGGRLTTFAQHDSRAVRSYLQGVR
ncbi:MAG: protein kinase, partial [Gemmatimonadales bacterium]